MWPCVLRRRSESATQNARRGGTGRALSWRACIIPQATAGHRERAVSELCWPIRARTAARHRADRPGTAARFGRATRTMDGRLVGGQRTGPETGSASDIRSSVRHCFVSPSMTGLYRKPLSDWAIESRRKPSSKSLDLTHTETARQRYRAVSRAARISGYGFRPTRHESPRKR